jgi:hypothetical protein
VPAGPIGTCWATGSWTDTCWEALTWATDAFIANNDQDMNTRIWSYLVNLYSAPVTSDLNTLVIRYLNAATGDMTARMAALIAAASS